MYVASMHVIGSWMTDVGIDTLTFWRSATIPSKPSSDALRIHANAFDSSACTGDIVIIRDLCIFSMPQSPSSMFPSLAPAVAAATAARASEHTGWCHTQNSRKMVRCIRVPEAQNIFRRAPCEVNYCQSTLSTCSVCFKCNIHAGKVIDRLSAAFANKTAGTLATRPEDTPTVDKKAIES